MLWYSNSYLSGVLGTVMIMGIPVWAQLQSGRQSRETSTRFPELLTHFRVEQLMLFSDFRALTE